MCSLGPISLGLWLGTTLWQTGMAKESCLLDTNKEAEEERVGLGPVIPLEVHPNDLSPQRCTVHP